MPKFPALAADGTRRIRQFSIAVASTYKLGAAVLLDAGEDLIEAGADPASILGFAAAPVTSGKLVGELADSSTDIGGAPVQLAEEGRLFWMAGDSNPVKADINQKFGLVKDADGIWTVDKTDIVNTKVHVHDVDLDRNLFLVSVLAANRQIAP